MLSKDLPIEGWKVNPTGQDGYDWALHTHPAHPDVDSLNRDEIEALLKRFDAVKITGDTHDRPKVLVAGGDQ
jgi:hypothetical protein